MVGKWSSKDGARKYPTSSMKYKMTTGGVLVNVHMQQLNVNPSGSLNRAPKKLLEYYYADKPE